jgi:hypothetical protein
MTELEKKTSTVTKDEDENHEEDENQEESEEQSEEEDDEECEDRVPIDLSQNEVYRGVCTLFEDDDGNNILEYISLLHTELIGINKSLENLRFIRKDITRLADCAELLVKGSKREEPQTEPKKKSKDTTRS